ncbi:MAG: hypothetical protein RG740_02705, partial [Acholeplasmataceae bacterium]|nr:hypothetical protein [Acholeplasmataceae bacterium]
MYIRLSKSKSTKDYIVYLVEGYRTKEGQTKQRTLKSFGYLSELTKDNPNALEDLKTWAKDETERLKQDKTLPITIELDKLQTIDKRPLNYGYVFLERLYNRIGLSGFMQNYQSKVKCQYNLDDILKLL